MNQNNIVQRLWDRDTTLWTDKPEIAQTIENRLGWLDCVEIFEKKLVAIRAFVDTLPYSNFVILGMGGSSLVSRVFDQAMPCRQRKCFVLDTTDPATIQEVQKQLPLEDTLFVVASKSGTTIEADCLFEYFFNLCPRGEQFIAITDFNTPLMHAAEKHKFRHTFVNPSDIGGRFSALSYFGLVSFGLMGGDVISFFEQARKTVEEYKKENNAAFLLAQTIFENHQSGKNKMYLNITPSYSNFGFWVEQLIAESTGKQGLGVIPILEGMPGPDGFVVNVNIQNVDELATEFFKWEMATAFLGAMMNVNPFDEPNVVSSKKNTGSYLQSSNASESIRNKIKEIAKSPFDVPAFVKGIAAPEFIGVLSYLPNPDKIKAFAKQTSVPVSICTGPSYLHSTGQLHKGGPNQGRFIIVVDDQDDLQIAGRPYGFQTLKLAQALGDYDALIGAGRKVLLIRI